MQGGASPALSLSAARLTPIESATLQRLRPALEQLEEARRIAEHFSRDIWELAIERDSLADAGMTSTDCRWLLCRGLIDHSLEVSLAGAPKRSFLRSQNLRFLRNSCFVLTELGVSEVAQARHAIGLEAAVPKPHWDRERHELRVGDVLVKRFRLPASNQETILEAFEEESWPARIDDPLPPTAGHDPKRKLHDTINSLNRNQKARVLRFYGDGSGYGVCWEAMPESDA